MLELYKYNIIIFSQRENFIKEASQALEEKSFTFQVANTYQALLGLVEKKNKCILLSDFLFNSYNGLEVLKRIKKDFECNPHLIFILESYDNSIIESLFKAGASDYIIENKFLKFNIQNRISLLINSLEKAEGEINQIKESQDNSDLTSIVSLIDDYVIVRKLKGSFISVNNSFLRALRYSEHEFMIMNPEDLIAPQALFEYQLEARLLREKKKHVYQTEFISKDKRIIPVEVSSTISTYQDDYVVISIARDISDRLETNDKLRRLNSDLEKINHEYKEQNDRLRNINREVEENRHALKLALQEAENAEQLKNKFLANMSHEIRTPMNAIVGFSQLLEDADAEDVGDFVRIINNNSETLLQLINDLMDIAKIESDLVAINTEEVVIHELMLDLETIFNFEKLNKGKKHIDIQYSVNGNQDLLIETDKLRIKQILMNLMNNALKFTEEGKIEIGFTTEKEGVNIYVKDTGVGIPIKMQQQIFERFQQIDHIEKPQGTGIGLSISRSLIRLLGGEIKLSSKVNNGSVFSIYHPFSQKGNNKVKPPQKNMVMIAEDEEDNYHLLKYVLKDLNLDVIWAKNGQEAIDLCKEKRVSLILMDIKMPTKTGLEATKEILEFMPNLPIIAQTAYTQDEDIERCRIAGCSEFIAKPINLTLLRRTISKYVK